MEENALEIAAQQIQEAAKLREEKSETDDLSKEISN